jgi:mannose-6-phosphate isomerase
MPGEMFIVGNALAGLWAVQKLNFADRRADMKLNKHLVEKPWGRTDIPAAFGDMSGRRIGEIWYEGDEPEPLPILVKWLFTSEKLSIQVHPNDEQAQARGMPSGKEECWYIVNAEPGAVLGMGTKRPLSSNELRSASLSGEIERLMEWRPVKAGEYFYIPAGTVHAIGAGIKLVEVQQYADITYRLYDYGRPRELHLDDGVSVSVAAPYSDKRSGYAVTGQQLVDGPQFNLWLVGNNMEIAELPEHDRYWVIPLSGRIENAHEKAMIGDCLIVDNFDSVTMSPDARLLIAA